MSEDYFASDPVPTGVERGNDYFDDDPIPNILDDAIKPTLTTEKGTS